MPCDSAADTVTLNGTPKADHVNLTREGDTVVEFGLPTETFITGSEKANDVLEALYRAQVRGVSMSRIQGHGGAAHGLGELGQRHHAGAVGEGGPQGPGDVQRQPRLAHPARAGERDQARPREQLLHLGGLGPAPDQAGHLGR